MNVAIFVQRIISHSITVQIIVFISKWTLHSVNFQIVYKSNVTHCWCLSHLKNHKQQSSASSSVLPNIIYRQSFFDRFPTDWASIALLTASAEIPFDKNSVKLTANSQVKAKREGKNYLQRMWCLQGRRTISISSSKHILQRIFSWKIQEFKI